MRHGLGNRARIFLFFSGDMFTFSIAKPFPIAFPIGKARARTLAMGARHTALRKTGAEETVYSKHQELKQANKQASATTKIFFLIDNQDTSR